MTDHRVPRTISFCHESIGRGRGSYASTTQLHHSEADLLYDTGYETCYGFGLGHRLDLSVA